MLNGKDLISLGLKPGKDFATILEKVSNMSSREAAIDFAKSFLDNNYRPAKSNAVKENSVLSLFLNDFRRFVPSFLESRTAEPSSSEIRRMFDNKAVVINGFAPPAEGCIDNQFPIWESIFFPSGKRKTTLISDKKPIDANPWFDCDGNILSGTDEEKQKWKEQIDGN